MEGFKLVREVVSARFKFVCANAKCPRIRAMVSLNGCLRFLLPPVYQGSSFHLR